MINIEKVEVCGWEAAIRGMRNSMNSWDRSDSRKCVLTDGGKVLEYFDIGANDYDLMMKLAKVGSDHAKYRRMIVVYADITAPLYWWKQFDTYKVGTVANSCSTIKTIADKEFELEDFSRDYLVINGVDQLEDIIKILNACRNDYLSAGKKVLICEKNIAFQKIIKFLPSSYNQKRTVMLNYEVLANIYKSRSNHKLYEWRDFCAWIKSLPYHKLITGDDEGDI